MLIKLNCKNEFQTLQKLCVNMYCVQKPAKENKPDKVYNGVFSDPPHGITSHINRSDFLFTNKRREKCRGNMEERRSATEREINEKYLKKLSGKTSAN